MASFFQAPLAAPPEAGSDSRFLIFWNSAIGGEIWTTEWYHYLVVCIGAGAFLLGSLIHLTRRLLQRKRLGNWRDPIEWLSSRFAHLRPVAPGIRILRSGRQHLSSRASSAEGADSSAYFSEIKSILVTTNSEEPEPCKFSPDTALRIITHSAADIWSIDFDAQHSRSTLMVPPRPDSRLSYRTMTKAPLLAAFDPQSVGASNNGWGEADDLAWLISKFLIAKNYDGLVLRHSSGGSSAYFNALLESLRVRLVPVIVEADADSPIWDELEFDLLDGVMLRNACVLPSGERRDFFRASRVRQCAAQVKQQRIHRHSFFLGFLETWDVPPSAAVLRRAYMLADFFGAIVQAEPVRGYGEEDPIKDPPMSGFDHLKTQDVTWLHKAWANHDKFLDEPSDDQALFSIDVSTITEVIPEANQLLSLQPVRSDHPKANESRHTIISAPPYAQDAPQRLDFWEYASCGAELCKLGCFSVREEITQDQYDQVVGIQRSLKHNRLLQIYREAENLRVTESLRPLVERSSFPELLRAFLEGLADGSIRIFRGLDSGFNLPDNGGHLWAVTECKETEKGSFLDIHVSLKAAKDVATIWHAFLAHHEVPRLQRFEEELLLNDDPEADLPMSISKELEESSEAELLYLLEQLCVCEQIHQFTESIIERVYTLLIAASTLTAWKSKHSSACLDDCTTIRSLLEQRLNFHASASRLPSLENLVAFYSHLLGRMDHALLHNDRTTMNQLTTPLLRPYGHAGTKHKVSPLTDIYGLIFFCALRKLAFENVYLETTDRCPVFLSQPDQAGVFAELWVLGSQCEIYFGVLPRTLGEIIYTRYRSYLMQRPPPVEAWDGKEVFTAYSTPQPRLSAALQSILFGSGSAMSPESNEPVRKSGDIRGAPRYRKVVKEAGALSIFCVPAIVDVLFLTFLGRGLYLTAYMPRDIKIMADCAILTALVMTGGVTGWVGSTGGFYLFNFAYDNMMHFLVQRFSAAMMLTFAVAGAGFIAFGIEYSWFAGFIYVLYLVPLSVFLTLLGIFATMHRSDSPLPSGRSAMWKCLPLLLISPILTIFIHGWDLLIYMLVIYTFTASLVIMFRRLCLEWTDWHLTVPDVKEKDLLAWFKRSNPCPSDADPTAFAAAARAALRAELVKARTSKCWSFKKPEELDPFVITIAKGLDYANFLLRKEAGEGELPELFTTTWFVQLGLALNNQRQLMRGLNEHSAFINYRYSRYDIGQNVGLFMAALLDRLVSVVMSARGRESVSFANTRNRYAICFALLHFLGGALAVDVVLQRCWDVASTISKDKLRGLSDLDLVLKSDESRRHSRYWTALAELMSLLLIIFGICTTLVSFLVDDFHSIVLFFAYVTSYTAVLLCQFHRCFTKSHRLHVITVLACCFVGFVVGCILRGVPQTAAFAFDFVIAQNTAAIGAVVGTGLLTTLTWKPSEKLDPPSDAATTRADMPLADSRSHSRNSSDCGEDQKAIPGANIHETNRRLLVHLCLGVDVNIGWIDLPEDVRRLILHRICGRPSQMSTKLQLWLAQQSHAISWHDQQLAMRLSVYRVEATLSKKGTSNWSPACTAHSLQQPSNLTSDLSRDSSSPESLLRNGMGAMMHSIDLLVQWIAILSGGAPDAPRELWYALHGSWGGPAYLWMLLKVWKVCWWSRRLCIYIFLIAGKQPAGRILDLGNRGARRTLRGPVVEVDMPTRKMTGFILRGRDGRLGVIAYDGIHQRMPKEKRPAGVGYYDDAFRMYRRDVYISGSKAVETFYQYDDSVSQRWPISKTTVENDHKLDIMYDKHGRPISGQVLRAGQTFDFEYSYAKRITNASDVLCATYKSNAEGASALFAVFWCVDGRNGSADIQDWVPSEKVQMLYASLAGQRYEIRWVYKHAQGADIEASVVDAHGKRRPCLPPPEILEDKYGFLKKPQHLHFDNEDLLIYHSSSSLKSLASSESSSKPTSFLPSRMLRWLELGEKVVYHRLPSSTLRTVLWQAWQTAPYIGAVTASYLDERLLRQEPLLREYWRLRDAGFLRRAAHALDQDLEQIISAIEPSFEASSKCSLLIKPSDLFIMGGSKDANQLTARLEDCYRDTETSTSVIFSDNGCWPDNPGGVSNCRRDLVNGHTTIRGHCLAESANDFGVSRYQIERNINSLKILPLWGLDGKTAYHGVFDNLLQGQVDKKCTATRSHQDIEQVFVPLLRSFVRGARSKRYSHQDLITYSNTILQMSKYFEKYDFNKTWNSKQVWRAWLEAWLFDYNDPNILSMRDCLEIEQPSLSDLRDALNLYICYFFVYSVGVPGDCPTVFQTTHHGISSLYGMILKYRKGTTWGLWDHAIAWRESCLNISPAQCLLPLPVQSMLLAGIKLACHLAYTHVDIVLPCTSVFNPDWEQELGTDGGLRGSKKVFARKIDPIVNGIGNMDNFSVITETRSKLPTTVMLSNVQFIKDVKTAVRAADVIINKYGFKDYRLVIYGAQDRQPSYALETVNLINSRGLAGKVILGGFGSPKEVLKDAWLFLNSSLSEGLPLAIGEAALSGVPIVATEVGATSLVLTDPDDMKRRYGEVVPPNDPEALARAQLSVLAMMGPWSAYTDDTESTRLPDTFTPKDVDRITKRMYEKADDRRKLGLKLREVVLRSFHGSRYLREHEQMYWIQRRRAEIRRSPRRPARHPFNCEAFGENVVFDYEGGIEDSSQQEFRWQDFGDAQERGHVGG